jgi:hypothetical protein
VMTTDINNPKFATEGNISPALPEQSHFIDVPFYVPFYGAM